ncbi:hypothetical protein SAMN05428997_10461 [Bosea sp. CRIB-10]|uniref:hypothetical protein n=1 Tax=Bosea sp. CRIB-10 TaxID=378404 RepID=UPI0008E5B898|nr:hypothetical protein [Bosea sp. CRIB-10]SFC09972.1 hypothetical protein SAMN05428997_10461 [Bosea sp. CRIB-10]
MMLPSTDRVELSISVHDAYDGLVRLLVDAQRFGWTLTELQATSRPDSSADIRLVVAAPQGIGRDVIAARLARHPSVAKVVVARGA